MEFSDFNKSFEDPMMYKQVDNWIKNKIPIRIIINQAILNNNFYIIDYLMSKGLNINGDNNNFYKSFIHDALIMNNFYMASKLILKGAKINYNFEYFRNSLLYYAMFIKNQECYDNSCQYYKRYPTEEQVKLIYLLVRKGIKLHYKDNKWKTPYEYAVKNNYPIKLCNLIYNEAKKQGSKEKYVEPTIKTYNDNLINTRNVFKNNLYVQNNTYNVPTFNEMVDIIGDNNDFVDNYHYYNKPYKSNRKDAYNNKMYNMYVNPYKSYYNYTLENTSGLKNRPISQSFNKRKDLKYDHWTMFNKFINSNK